MTLAGGLEVLHRRNYMSLVVMLFVSRLYHISGNFEIFPESGVEEKKRDSNTAVFP